MDALRALIPSEYYFPVLALVILIALLAAAFFWPSWKFQRPNYVLAIVIAVMLLIVMRSSVSDRWSWMLGLLPTLLVSYQAFYLWLSQPKEVEGGIIEPNVNLKSARERAHKTIASQFGLKTLFIRYGFPAALLGIIGIVIMNVLIKPGQFLSLITLITTSPEIVKINPKTIDRVLLGLRMGALGAYLYVLLELGRRTFRHDVTGASAMWCLVTLVMGPVLAGTVAVLWRMDAPPPDASSWWPGGVVLFFAGYAPRRVIAAIEQAAIQLLKIGGPSGVAPTRQIPLSQVRGIGPQIEERLSEEGIDDVNALASAEPIRLLRNTSFDLRQILSWIDEAILIVTLPRSWQALEDEGITGAIDLAWYAYGLDMGIPTDTLPEEVKARREEQEKAFQGLADKAKMEKQSLLATIQRLREDRQVQDVWALYNSFTGSMGSGGTGDGETVSTVTQDGSEPG